MRKTGRKINIVYTLSDLRFTAWLTPASFLGGCSDIVNCYFGTNRQQCSIAFDGCYAIEWIETLLKVNERSHDQFGCISQALLVASWDITNSNSNSFDRYYSCARQTRHWPTRIFNFVFNAAAFTAFVLWDMTSQEASRSADKSFINPVYPVWTAMMTSLKGVYEIASVTVGISRTGCRCIAIFGLRRLYWILWATTLSVIVRFPGQAYAKTPM